MSLASGRCKLWVRWRGETRSVGVDAIAAFSALAEPRRGRSRHTGDRLELAWDGHRVLACRAGNDVRLFSADFREWTKTFPRCARRYASSRRRRSSSTGSCARSTSARDPSFEALREYVKKPTPGAHVVFAVWDVPRLDDEEICADAAARERAATLAAFFAGAKDPLVVSRSRSTARRSRCSKTLDAMGVRGLVARAPNATYDAPCVPLGATSRSSGTAASPPPPAVTNADKLLYPRDGITKTDIARYYDEVARAAAPRDARSSRGVSALARRHRRLHLVPAPHAAARAGLSPRRVDRGQSPRRHRDARRASCGW